MGNEKGICQAINSLLAYKENLGQLLFQRNNSFVGAITRRDGSSGFIKNGKRGSPDYYIFLPSGQTIHLEVKAEKGKQSVEQLEWEMKCKKLGHKYCLVRSIDDVEKILLLTPYRI